ncbi:hypothetical protein NL676_004957 [Syzygium grande]|nr:hypothetical protein NL676_004957 [Syzygium grande]
MQINVNSVLRWRYAHLLLVVHLAKKAKCCSATWGETFDIIATLMYRVTDKRSTIYRNKENDLSSDS